MENILPTMVYFFNLCPITSLTLKGRVYFTNKKDGGGGIMAPTLIFYIYFITEKYIIREYKRFDTTSWIRVTQKSRPFLSRNLLGFDFKFSFLPEIFGLRSLSVCKVMLFGHILTFLHFLGHPRLSAPSRQSGIPKTFANSFLNTF